jgi:hypothetical protein
MKEFINRFFQVTIAPDTFFTRIRCEQSWKMPLFHLFALSVLLSLGSVIAWSAGVRGDSPINSALSVQMDLYPYWRDTLLPQFGFWSYPLTMGLMIVEMLVISVVYVPVIFLIFRYLGGEKEPGGLLHAFQGFVYGLTPAVFGGFLPWLGLATGIYTTILQLYRGPSITLKNQTFFAYVPIIVVLTYAIARYWQGGLL